jgi:hypothetical protein
MQTALPCSATLPVWRKLCHVESFNEKFTVDLYNSSWWKFTAGTVRVLQLVPAWSMLQLPRHAWWGLRVLCTPAAFLSRSTSSASAAHVTVKRKDSVKVGYSWLCDKPGA